MTHHQAVMHLPFAAGMLVGIGLCIAVIAVIFIAFLWSDE